MKNNEAAFRFCEIEFYIWSKDHPDLYSHKAPQQKEFGQWYFHESGLDITFGDQLSYASFLVRGMRKENTLEGERFVSGPLNVLKTLCNSNQKIDQRGINIQVEYSDDLQKTDWVNHQRIGLNMKKEIGENLFYDKPYRYISWLEADHGFKNRTKVLEDAFKSGTEKQIVQNAFNYKPKFLK